MILQSKWKRNVPNPNVNKGKPLEEMKILVVEDQNDMLMLIRNMLREFGVTQVYHAKTGKSALDFIDEAIDMVDIVLCDWNMPGMTGVELLRQFRSVDVSTPFVMVTGRSDHESVAEAKTCGVSAYIRKPFSPDQLEVKLRAVTHRMAASA